MLELDGAIGGLQQKYNFQPLQEWLEEDRKYFHQLQQMLSNIRQSKQ